MLERGANGQAARNKVVIRESDERNCQMKAEMSMGNVNLMEGQEMKKDFFKKSSVAMHPRLTFVCTTWPDFCCLHADRHCLF